MQVIYIIYIYTCVLVFQRLKLMCLWGYMVFHMKSKNLTFCLYYTEKLGNFYTETKIEL